MAYNGGLKRRESWMLGSENQPSTSGAASSPSTSTVPAAVLPQLDETSEDGPVFRATLNDLEKGVLTFRKKVKHILRATSSYVEANRTSDDLAMELLESMRGINILLPAITYLEQAFNALNAVKADYLNQLENLVLQPLKGMYENDLLPVDERKKVFDKESSEYYVYQEKYLALDREKVKRKNDSGIKDKKFQQKRATFNLKRFDYLTFMEELNTKKQQELLYHVSNLAEKQHRYYLRSYKSLEVLKPQLDELTYYSTRSWADISSWIKDRQNIRKNIEDSQNAAAEAIEEKAANLPENVSKYKGIRDLDLTVDTSQRPSTEVKEGFLFTQGSKGNWKQVWCVLSDGWFQESPSWKADTIGRSPKRIDLRFCAAKEALKAERRFCFEIISPNSKRIYQASSEEDVKTWLAVIQRAIESSLELPTPIATDNNRRNGPDKDWLRGELTKTPANLFCADCGAADPDWCSINLGVMLCIACSGIHRSLGTHISKIRSINLDTVSWTPELVELQKALGNQVTNSVWEATMPPEKKPQPSFSRDIKLKFIKEKYCDTAFVLPLDPAYENPFSMLMDAIANEDILRAYHAIALGADTNELSTDPKYEGKGPLHLAISKGNLVFAELILQNRGEVDLQDGRLFTSLHYACQNGDHICSAYLISKGANKDLKNQDGQTAAELDPTSPPSSPTQDFDPSFRSHQFGGPPAVEVTQPTPPHSGSPQRPNSVRPRAISMFNPRSPFSSNIY